MRVEVWSGTPSGSETENGKAQVCNCVGSWVSGCVGEVERVCVWLRGSE